jgi:hypothetical protein
MKSSKETKQRIKDWADENVHSPKNNGEYLCYVKWYNSSNYSYAILEFNTETKWQVTDSCEHIFWRQIQPAPFN